MDSDTKLGFAAEDLTFGQMNALVKKIGGKQKVEDFLQGDFKIIPDWKVWMEIPLGEFKSGWKYIEQIKRVRKMNIEEYAYGALEKKDFPCSPIPDIAHLVLTTPEELGFAKEPTLLELYTRAAQWGLKLCRFEVAPALILAEAATTRLMHIATLILTRSEECISEEVDDPFIFTIGDMGVKPTLGAAVAMSRRQFKLHSWFVFEMIV